MVYYSKFPARKVSNTVPLHNLIFDEKRTKVPRDKTLYYDIENPEKQITFSQAHEQILKVGAALQKVLDLKRGDVIAVCSPNQVEYPIMLLGAHCVGVVPAAIDYASSPANIASDLDIVKPKAVIAHPETLDNVLEAVKIYGLDQSNVLVLGSQDIKGIRAVDTTLLGGDELATPYNYTPEEIVNDPAYLYFTSGTTGRKKAVIITQYMLINYLTLIDEIQIPIANMLGYTEFHHASSVLISMHQCLFMGSPVYVMPHYSFDKLCAAIEKYQINMMVLQPYILSALAKEQVTSKYNLTSLKSVICCGAALDKSVISTVKERLNLDVFNGYGMTEIVGLFVTTPAISLSGGLGYLASGYSAKLIDEEGNEVPTGQMGELIVKGPTMTVGYYKNPEATAAAMDAEGYLHTGDLLRCDETGMFFYVDRAKDLIKYQRHQIYPNDIETVLMGHPKVSDCAVIGVYYPEIVTELPRAYVLLANNEKHSDAVAEEIKEYVHSQLPEHKHLRGGLIIVDSFPRTPIGKIKRRVLRQQANEALKA
ncbi:hypothetical protein EDC96DRAFT_567073 [Choanephora cucurbitarum]|nr:hypothetical protein EDC96DRAFT_567073 [Choanephora cucurbitarum]